MGSWMQCNNWMECCPAAEMMTEMQPRAVCSWAHLVTTLDGLLLERPVHEVGQKLRREAAGSRPCVCKLGWGSHPTNTNNSMVLVCLPCTR